MPYVAVSTSAPLPAEPERIALLSGISSVVAEHLGKPESYVMTRLEPSASMTFGGSSDPCCCIDVRGIGAPSPVQATALNAALCQHVEATLGVAATRTFVVFVDVPRALWGLGGRMLG